MKTWNCSKETNISSKEFTQVDYFDDGKTRNANQNLLTFLKEENILLRKLLEEKDSFILEK